jgi:hypothetical protein
MLCGIGSTMSAATPPGRSSSSRSTASASLKGTMIVASRISGRIPCERILAPDAVGPQDDVHRDAVVPAVVAALHLEHEPPAGRGAREAQRVEGRLAARRGQQHLLDRRHVLDDPLRELDLERRDAHAHEVDGAQGRGDGVVDVGVVVPEQRRPEGGVVVREDAALGVGEGRAAVAVTTSSSSPGTSRWPLLTPPGMTRRAHWTSSAGLLLVCSIIALLSGAEGAVDHNRCVRQRGRCLEREERRDIGDLLGGARESRRRTRVGGRGRGRAPARRAPSSATRRSPGRAR